MRVRDLLTFIDDHQELVIYANEDGKAIVGTAQEIRQKQDKKKVKEFLDRNIITVYNHCWKLYIIVKKFTRRWN